LFRDCFAESIPEVQGSCKTIGFWNQSAQIYNLGQKQKKNTLGQKQKMHAEAKAGNTSGPHDVGRPSAATMW